MIMSFLDDYPCYYNLAGAAGCYLSPSEQHQGHCLRAPELPSTAQQVEISSSRSQDLGHDDRKL